MHPSTLRRSGDHRGPPERPRCSKSRVRSWLKETGAVTNPERAEAENSAGPTKRLAPPAGVDSEWTESSSAGRSQRRTTEAIGRSQPPTNGLGIRYSKLARIVRVVFSRFIRSPHLAQLAERAQACTHVAPDVAPDVAEVVRLAGVIAACGELPTCSYPNHLA